MKHVLLVTLEMIPSAVLCGDAPLRHLAERGRIEYRWRTPKRLRGRDLRWADAVIFVRGDDYLSRKAAAVARRSGRYTVYVMDDDLLDESRELGGMYRELAAKKDCLFADSAEWDIELSYDGVHFSPEGHAVFAQKLENVLKDLMGSVN